MELGIIILSIVGLLGVFSIWQNSRKNAVVHGVIQSYLDSKGADLIDVIRPTDSGPFEDSYYDEQNDNLYRNIGYQSKETVYRIITYKTPSGQEKKAWLQLRIENLSATYYSWEEVS